MDYDATHIVWVSFQAGSYARPHWALALWKFSSAFGKIVKDCEGKGLLVILGPSTVPIMNFVKSFAPWETVHKVKTGRAKVNDNAAFLRMVGIVQAWTRNGKTFI